MEFKSLELHPDLARGIEDSGFETAMPVQAEVFAHAFKGDDIYAQSQTGTGKTAAFLIPILQRIMTVSELRRRKVLVLAPTRELAAQIEGEVRKIGKHLPITSACFYGGVGYGPQIDALRNDVQIMIGTPGRIIDLIQQGIMMLKEVGFLVIDEADRMFDMGFIDDLRKLIRYLPPKEERQTFLFSATLGLRVKDLAWEYMVSPHEIVIEPEHMTVDLVTQELHHVGRHEKMRLLLGILDRDKPASAIIFANQKTMVEEISRRLKINGIDNEYIMGDLPQSKRLDIIERLKAGRLSILVATDVAARGLDVEALDLVVNYDIPEDTESYVHRIGRTARAGKAGKAVTLACEKFVFGLPAIEKFIGMKIPVAGWNPDLMLEDRSSGMRFGRSSREVAVNRSSDSRGRGEGGRRSEGPRRDSRGHGEGRGEHRRDTRPMPSRSQEPRPPRPAEPRKPVPAPPAREATSAYGNENPYALSQEERLARFKEKYGTTPPPKGTRTLPVGADEPGRGNPRNQPRRPEGRGPATAQPPRRAGQPEPHGQRKKGGPTSPGAPVRTTPNGIVPAAVPLAKKPGLFDRIKRLFGRKPSD